MSRHYCNKESSCCNNNCCNPCEGYSNGVLGFGNSFFYILAILLIFGGGGFGPGSFFGDYNNIYRCSGFNTGWCNDNGSNNSIFNNSNFSSNTLSNSNFSNSNIAGLISGLSGNGNFDIGNLTDFTN
ncbi:hypothetical protein [Clostridium saudiense]|uniref:hypothetical protein n=1 Tax=Clostridium saudiense TaxID=1414720 RepID=UPI00319E13B0